jgi:hypothetical protein
MPRSPVARVRRVSIKNTWAQAQVDGITGPGTGKTPEITVLGISEDAVTGIGPVAPALSRQAAVFSLPAR